jgi:hypothetical protein
MPFRKDGNQGKAQHIIFAANNAAQTLLEFRGAAGGGTH